MGASQHTANFTTVNSTQWKPCEEHLEVMSGEFLTVACRVVTRGFHLLYLSSNRTFLARER